MDFIALVLSQVFVIVLQALIVVGLIAMVILAIELFLDALIKLKGKKK